MSLYKYGKRSAEIPVSNYIHQLDHEATLHLCLVNLPVELMFDSVGQLEPDDCVPMTNYNLAT